MMKNTTLGEIIALAQPTIGYEERLGEPEGSLPVEIKERVIEDALVDLLMLEGDDENDEDDGQPVRIKLPSIPPANLVEYELANAMFAKPTPKEEIRQLLEG